MRIVLAALGALAATTAAAQPPEAVEEGIAIVQQWCANCHAADVAGRGTDAVPSMARIAATRTDRELRAFLSDPHPALMPPVGLGSREIEAVLAYMGSLRDGEVAEERDSSTSRASP